MESRGACRARFNKTRQGLGGHEEAHDLGRVFGLQKDVPRVEDEGDAGDVADVVAGQGGLLHAGDVDLAWLRGLDGGRVKAAREEGAEALADRDVEVRLGGQFHEDLSADWNERLEDLGEVHALRARPVLEEDHVRAVVVNEIAVLGRDDAADIVSAVVGAHMADACAASPDHGHDDEVEGAELLVPVVEPKGVIVAVLGVGLEEAEVDATGAAAVDNERAEGFVVGAPDGVARVGHELVLDLDVAGR